ncbi:MAG: DUF222 domain-containing protein [Canibacter sp.]
MPLEDPSPVDPPADAVAPDHASTGALDSYDDASGLSVDFWDRELELLNHLYPDDDLDDADDDDALPVPDTLPVSFELLAHTQDAFLSSVPDPVGALSSNLSKNPLPEVGATIVGSDEPEQYTAIDRVHHITQRLELIEQAERMLAAARAKLLAEIPDSYSTAADGVDDTYHDPQGMGVLSAANLIAVKTQTSDTTIKSHINYAYQLACTMPGVFTELEQGRISFAHAVEIAKAGANLPEHTLPHYVEQAVHLARSATPGRLRRRLPKLVASLSPECTQALTKRAYAERRVWVSESDDGMAMVGAILPAPLALAAYDRMTRLAKQAMREMPTKTSDTAQDTDGIAPHVKDERSIDQARADVFAELLLASTAQRPDHHTDREFGLGIDAKIQVTVPVTTFLNTSNADHTGADHTDTDNGGITAGFDNAAPELAELQGYGLIDPDIARCFAADAKSWDRIFITPDGSILTTDNYQPTVAIKRHILARDQHCRFPGCLAPPTQCEIDHTHDAAKGGPTSTCNLAFLCKRHHALKHPSVHETARWNVLQLPGGVMEWQSPDGQVFKDLPDLPVGTVQPLVTPKAATKRVVRFRPVEPDDTDEPDLDGDGEPVWQHAKAEKYVTEVPVTPPRDYTDVKPWGGEDGYETYWNEKKQRPF